MHTCFGPFVFDREAHRLDRDGRLLAVQPKVLEALDLLLQRPGEVVSHHELIAALWPDVVVTQQSLRQVVRKLREALGDDERRPRYVATVHGRGYRFLPELRRSVPVSAERDLFVGRVAELAALAGAVDGSRLVTVLGIGGVGKTRLVRHFVGRWSGPRWMVELEEARTLHGIVGAVGSALDVPLGNGDPVDQLGRVIGARGPCLVVLDNFEQVARHARATVGRWLDLAPEARFVVTSREVLGIDGERPLTLAPMTDVDAVALFVARASIAPADEAEVPRLVELLDGLPLAIELAAARTRALSPAEIRARMGDRFAVLARAGRPHDRHATLRATLEWSWSLLSPDERREMAELSVFEGSFTPTSAEAVTRAGDLDVLQALVDKSLVHRRGGRLAMLLSVRAYAVEVAEPAVRVDAERRHGEHFARLGAPEVLLAAERSVERFEALRAELDNLVVACRRAMADRRLEVARAALAAVWSVVRRAGPIAVAGSLVDELSALSLDPRTLAEVSVIAAHVGQRSERAAECLPLALRARSAARAVGSAPLEVEALAILGACLTEVGRVPEAVDVLTEGLERAEQVGDPLSVARVMAALGYARWRVGEREVGIGLVDRALQLDRQAGGSAYTRWILGTLTSIHADEGRWTIARLRNEEALAESERYHHRFGVVQAMAFRAMSTFHLGELEEGHRTAEQALALARELGWRVQEGWLALNLGRMELELGRPTARAWLERALAVLRSAERSIPVAMALGFLAWCEPTPAEAWATAQDGLALARQIGDSRTTSNLLLFAATVAPDPDTHTAYLNEALACARACNDPLGVVVVASHLALAESPSPAVEARLDEQLAYFERVGQRVEWGRVVAARAERAARDGDEEALARWLELGRDVPVGSRAAASLARLRRGNELISVR